MADLLETLVLRQDKQADLALLKDAIGIDSVTGNEAEFAAYLRRQMVALGMATDLAEFLPGRPNVWGQRIGAGTGKHLLICGHTDTVHVRGWAETWQGDSRENPFGAAQVDGEIYGRGACDLKGGICTAIAALRLLDRAGVTLKGDLSFAFIGDEESGEPGTGISAGIKDLVKRMKREARATPDFAIYVEPTSLRVYTAQIGFFIAEIVVTGRSAYFGQPELGADALRAAHAVLSAIWAHGAKLSDAPAHDLLGTPNILVTHMESGGYIAVPGLAKLSVIRKLTPGESLDGAVADFEAAIRAVPLSEGISVAITYPAGRDHALGGSPVEIDPDLAAVRLLAQSLNAACPGAGQIGGAPYWSETPFLINEIGCPAVYCAPGDIANAHTFNERIAIDEYLSAIRAFALFIARHCGTLNLN